MEHCKVNTRSIAKTNAYREIRACAQDDLATAPTAMATSDGDDDGDGDNDGDGDMATITTKTTRTRTMTARRRGISIAIFVACGAASIGAPHRPCRSRRPRFLSRP